MRKRGLLVVFMLTCLGLIGCNNNGSYIDTGVDDEHAEEILLSEDEDVDPNEGDYTGEEGDEETTVNPEEIEGIVAMVLNATTYTSAVQVIAIDPSTGNQAIISEFDLDFDQDNPYNWLDSTYCVMRERFSDDYTKLAVNRHLVKAHEEHAGWFDTDGSFFDVTAAISTNTEPDFFDTSSVRQRAIGFKNSQFVFLDLTTNEVYCVPVDDVSASTVCKAGEDDAFASLVQHPTPALRLSYRIDANTYIGDFDDYNYSVIYDIGSGKANHYIPEAARYNWSGVMSPDSNMVAFLSAARGGGAVNLYTMSMSDKSPTAIIPEPNESVVVDWSTLKVGYPFSEPALCGLDGIFADYNNEKQQCCLLEWK